MALGLPQNTGGGGDRVAVIKYDARAGRIFRLDRTQDANGEWQSDQPEITTGFQAIMDLENIQVGYLAFPAGAAPQMSLVKLGEPIGEKPSDLHKPGFRVIMKLGKVSGGDVREMASNAQVSVTAMDDLHNLYVKGVAENPGKLPIVTLASTTPIVTKGKDKDGRPQTSTNYQPVWSIVKWIDRPPELTAGHVAAANEPTAQPQTTTQLKTTTQEKPVEVEDQF